MVRKQTEVACASALIAATLLHFGVKNVSCSGHHSFQSLHTLLWWSILCVDVVALVQNFS